MKIVDQGSVVLFTPSNDEETKWLQENTDSESWQWLGKSLVVDHRMADGLIDGVNDAGFVLS